MFVSVISGSVSHLTAVGLIASYSGNHQAVGKLLLSPTLTMKWAQGSLCHLVAFPRLQFICHFANCTGWARLSHLPRSFLFWVCFRSHVVHTCCVARNFPTLLPSLLSPEITGNTTVPDIMCAGAWTQSLCTLNRRFPNGVHFVLRQGYSGLLWVHLTFQADLDHWTRPFPCLSLPSAKIAGVHHHTTLLFLPVVLVEVL